MRKIERRTQFSRRGFLNNTTVRGRRSKHFARRGRLERLLSLVLWRGGDVVVFFEMFQEIADVQEGVAIETNIHEGRLHPR